MYLKDAAFASNGYFIVCIELRHAKYDRLWVEYPFCTYSTLLCRQFLHIFAIVLCGIFNINFVLAISATPPIWMLMDFFVCSLNILLGVCHSLDWRLKRSDRCDCCGVFVMVFCCDDDFFSSCTTVPFWVFQTWFV